MKNILFLLLSAALPALADTTFDNTQKFAWSANSGWISFRHDQPSSPEGVVFGGAFLSGYAYSANLGWINFGNGNPSNGYVYSNTNSSDYGVNHDGQGNLSGYAWSANCGWINFGWSTLTDSNRPRVNLLSGAFSGYAWGANIGWINLGTGLLTTQSMTDADTDNDGIADWWEKLHFLNLAIAHQTSHSDGDGVSDLNEYLANTNPKDADAYLKIVRHLHDLDSTETTLIFTTTPTRLYRIEFSNDLGQADPWTDSALATFAPDAGPTTAKTFTYPGNPKKFFRAVSLMPVP